MVSVETEKVNRKATDTALIALFVLLICLPTLDSLFNLDRTRPPEEKRRLAEMPQFKWEWRAYVEFPGNLEAHLNDHFGYRNWLIYAHNYVTVSWLGTVTSPSVIKGKDDWLFFSGDRVLEYTRATDPFTAEELKQWRDVIEDRRDWLTGRGAHYLIVIVPNKHTIYREMLPDWLAEIGKKSRLDQLVEYLRANSSVEVLDLRDALLKAKTHGRLYHKLDSHWNDIGAFAAYEAIIARLSEWFPKLRALPREDFIERTTREPGGDLATMLGQQDVLKEDKITLVPKQPLSASKTDPGYLLPLRAWSKEAEPVVMERPGAAAGTVVVFRDSLSTALIPFLSEHFARTVCLWQQEFDRDVIERENPVLVIHQIGERVLMKRGFLKESDSAKDDRQ
jgi:alginate O-acetyltransferase complex protein AlgJ